VPPCTVLRVLDRRGLAQFLQQCLGVLQVGGVEALGKPAVDRREEVVGSLPVAPLASDARKVVRRPKLPHLCALSPGDFERSSQVPLRAAMIITPLE
jgi:hypothetical protein